MTQQGTTTSMRAYHIYLCAFPVNGALAEGNLDFRNESQNIGNHSPPRSTSQIKHL